jgi:hypothetical protein
MSVQQIKQQYPDVYQQIYDRGAKSVKRKAYEIRRTEELTTAVRRSFEMEAAPIF